MSEQENARLADDTQFRCTVCGQIGTVGRCCGLDTREPLNDLARAELAAEEPRRANSLLVRNDTPAGQGWRTKASGVLHRCLNVLGRL